MGPVLNNLSSLYDFCYALLHHLLLPLVLAEVSPHTEGVTHLTFGAILGDLIIHVFSGIRGGNVVVD